MPYFLDGNNLIGRARGCDRPSEEDRFALVSEIADRLRRTNARALLFFDGAGQRRTTLGQLSIQASTGGSADDAIIGEIGRAASPQEIVVVTADRDLSRRARDLGAKVLAPEQFWTRLGAAARPVEKQGDRAIDVEEWMRYFEDEGNRKT